MLLELEMTAKKGKDFNQMLIRATFHSCNNIVRKRKWIKFWVTASENNSTQICLGKISSYFCCLSHLHTIMKSVIHPSIHYCGRKIAKIESTCLVWRSVEGSLWSDFEKTTKTERTRINKISIVIVYLNLRIYERRRVNERWMVENVNFARLILLDLPRFCVLRCVLFNGNPSDSIRKGERFKINFWRIY